MKIQDLQSDEPRIVLQMCTKSPEDGERSAHRRAVMSALRGYFDRRKPEPKSSEKPKPESGPPSGVRGGLFGEPPPDVRIDTTAYVSAYASASTRPLSMNGRSRERYVGECRSSLRRHAGTLLARVANLGGFLVYPDASRRLWWTNAGASVPEHVGFQIRQNSGI